MTSEVMCTGLPRSAGAKTEDAVVARWQREVGLPRKDPLSPVAVERSRPADRERNAVPQRSECQRWLWIGAPRDDHAFVLVYDPAGD